MPGYNRRARCYEGYYLPPVFLLPGFGVPASGVGGFGSLNRCASSRLMPEAIRASLSFSYLSGILVVSLLSVYATTAMPVVAYVGTGPAIATPVLVESFVLLMLVQLSIRMSPSV